MSECKQLENFVATYREKLCGRSVTFNEFRGLRRSNIVHVKQRTLSRLTGLQTSERMREMQEFIFQRRILYKNMRKQ